MITENKETGRTSNIITISDQSGITRNMAKNKIYNTKKSTIKNKLKLIILTMLVLFIFPVCDINAEEKESDDNEIVFVKRMCDVSWGWMYCTDRGYFIDEQGNVYEFNLAEFDKEIFNETFPEGEEFMDLLDEIHRVTLPVCAINKLYVEWCNIVAGKVDIYAEMEREQVAQDCGSNTLYYVVEGELIEIYSDGDYESVLDDIYAKYIRYMFSTQIEPEIESQTEAENQ